MAAPSHLDTHTMLPFHWAGVNMTIHHNWKGTDKRMRKNVNKGKRLYSFFFFLNYTKLPFKKHGS